MRRVLSIQIAAWLLLACASAAAQTPGAGSAAPGSVDCSALAGAPNSPLGNADFCRQMMNSAQQSAASLQDARGARPGDEAMSCQDIAKEMSTMQGIGLSDASRAEGDAASAQYGAVVSSQLARLHAQGVAGAVAVTAAAAADLAVQLATAGLVNPHAAQTLQQAALTGSKAQGEQMAEERRPAEQRVANAVGKSTREMSEQLQSNPRFARLVSLAMAKGCRGSEDTPTPSPLQIRPGMSPIGH
ncbi:MAG: hypothetical protein U1F17_10480 [Burkholderiaceae bacterium]